MMGYFLAARAGEFAAVDPTLEQLIGHKPQSMRDYLSYALGWHAARSCDVTAGSGKSCAAAYRLPAEAGHTIVKRSVQHHICGIVFSHVAKTTG